MLVEANGLRLEALVDEPQGGCAAHVLLIMGLGGQLIHWPPALVQALVNAGLGVIRLDNRDAGLSTHLDHLGKPNLGWIATRAWLGARPRVPYTLTDMANDALGVLDALGVTRAHVVGLSMGAMIAQRVALAAPQRVLSLTSIMGASGARGLLKPKARVMRAAASKPATDLASPISPRRAISTAWSRGTRTNSMNSPSSHFCSPVSTSVAR